MGNAGVWQGRSGAPDSPLDARFGTQKSKSPGRSARAFLGSKNDQAAGRNSLEALALIGSTVSVATF
jgi:hypothetical protein